MPILEQKNRDELVDKYLHNAVGALMQTVNIKALAEVSKNYSDDNDFNNSQESGKSRKIRGWYCHFQWGITLTKTREQ